MGRIKYSGAQKAFEGTAGSIPDNQSIQKAVKGTLTAGEQSSVIKNMLTIASASYLDMFDPKRTSAPVDMVSYRGFPILTINLANVEGLVFPSASSHEGYINFTLNSNTRRVGYPYQLFIQGWSGDGFTPPNEPDSPGQSSNYNETVLNVSGGFVLNQTIQLSFDEVDVDILSEVAEFTIRVNYKDNPWEDGLVSNQFYFNSPTTESKGTFGEYQFTVSPSVWENPYPYSFTIIPLDGTSCGSQVNGSQFTLFSDSSDVLLLGSAASLASDVMDPITTGGYSYELNGTYYVLTITNNSGNSSITAVTDCGNTPPIQP